MRRRPLGASPSRGNTVAALAGHRASSRRRSAARLHFVAYLPAGYDAGAHALSGHLPPARAAGRAEPAYRGVGFVERALDATGSPAILIVPQGLDRQRAPIPEYLDRGPGDRWDTAIATRARAHRRRAFPHDPRHATGRALVGVSAGGYGAMHLALNHLDRVLRRRVLERVLPPHRSDRARRRSTWARRANAQADVHQSAPGDAHAAQDARRRYIAFYVGHERHALLGRERAAEPGAVASGDPARLPGLLRRPRSGPVAAVRDALADARARSTSAHGARLGFGRGHDGEADDARSARLPRDRRAARRRGAGDPRHGAPVRPRAHRSRRRRVVRAGDPARASS